jgi:Ca2+-transporting ATPase
MATGPRSELGKIGRALSRVEQEATLLERETRRLVRVLAVVGLAACAIVVVTYAITRGGDAIAWKQGLLAGIALAMAALPEEFPVVLTIFFALGAWRISRTNVLTRRMPAIETLGAATVLCVDKTGTLTQNRMTLRRLVGAGDTWDSKDSRPLSGSLQELLELAVLASKRDPFDPMERALHESGSAELPEARKHPTWSLVREYPLSPELLAVSHAWATGAGDELVVAAKGAPEAIAALCAVPPERHAELMRGFACSAWQRAWRLAAHCRASSASSRFRSSAWWG